MVNRLLFWIVVGVFVGGHLGDAFLYHWDDYARDPIKFLQPWSGLSSFGGFFACAILVAVFLWRTRVPFWPFADVVAYGLAGGWFLGRMGCTAAHDHPGRWTDFWLGIPWPHYVDERVNGVMQKVMDGCGAARHDLGFYEALFTLVMLLCFVWLDRKPRFPGFFMGWMVTAYAPVRFAMDFLRTDDVKHDFLWHWGLRHLGIPYFGLTPGQFGSLLLLPLGLMILIPRWRQPPFRRSGT
jgi:phosphatidylglycerol:prolipoprotein diacylglycerol transferase